MKDQLGTWQSAVIIPAAQAAVTGILTGAIAGAAAVLARAENPAVIGLGVFGLTSLASWLAYRRDWARRINAIAGVFDELKAKRLEASTIRLEVISDNGRAGDFLNLPGGPDRLYMLASGITAGIPFTVRAWTGKSGIYQPGEFDQLRGELIRRGLATWRSPHDNRSGVVLTCAGKAVMRKLAAQRSPTPSGKVTYLPRDEYSQGFQHAHTDTHKG